MAKMKAAIYHGPGDIRIEEIERPKAEDGVEGLGVVCKLGACGVCDILDLPPYQGTSWSAEKEVAMGHEDCLEVIEVGNKVTAVKVGDKIHANAYHPGLKYKPLDPAVGRRLHGAFAEYKLFPFITEENVIKIPETMSFRDGALIEPTRLSLALAEKVKPDDDNVVVVIGLKYLALATIVRLKAIGVEKVIAIDISKKRLKKAEELGADILVNEVNQNIVEAVMKETAGQGARVVIETSGRPANFQKAVDMVAEGDIKTGPIGGTIWLTQAFEAPFMFNGRVKGGTSIRHAWGTVALWKPLWIQSVDFIQSKLPATKVVSHIFPLDKIKEAFETALTDDSIKVMIEA